MQENNRNSKGTGEPSARRLAMDSLSGIAGGRYGSLSVDAVLRRSALEGADRGLYAALVFGVLERQTTLDFLAEQLSARPPEQLDLPVLLALRLGLYQLIYMDRVPDYAAIGETVSLVPRRAAATSMRYCAGTCAWRNGWAVTGRTVCARRRTGRDGSRCWRETAAGRCRLPTGCRSRCAIR